MTQFFGHNFEDERWHKAALKNAFSLLGKQRFEHSAAFFLLAGCLRDAIEVMNKMFLKIALSSLNSLSRAEIFIFLFQLRYNGNNTRLNTWIN